MQVSANTKNKYFLILLYFIGNLVYFQQCGNKLYLLSDPIFLSSIPHACTGRLKRLDQIVNFLKLHPSEKHHKDFTQTIENGVIKIEPCPIASGYFQAAEWLYDLRINIWQDTIHGKIQTRIGTLQNKTEVNLVNLQNGGLVFISDDCYFNGLLRCKNYQKGCLVRMKSRKQLEKHNLKCKTLEEVSILYKISNHSHAFAKKYRRLPMFVIF